MLGKVALDDHVNALERYWKCDKSYTKPLNGSLSKIKGHQRSNFAQCTKPPERPGLPKGDLVW